MKSIIVGLGIQGKKRLKDIKIKKEIFATVDHINKDADYKFLKEVPLNSYDTAIISVHNQAKLKIIEYLIKNKKNIMVEKPFLINTEKLFIKLKKLILQNKIVFYTAYNHRFEPHIVELKKLLKRGVIGKIYYTNFFYGNGTAKLVKKDKFKDSGNGIIDDLGSHIIDLCFFLYGDKIKNFQTISKKKFENNSNDYSIFIHKDRKFHIKAELSYCMWKNNFVCNIIGSKGSIHLNGLCKWGPSELIIRKRKFPSGVPLERKKVLRIKDPTWSKEYLHFKKLVKSKRNLLNNILKDKKISQRLLNL
tara:strand:- start:1234 stop:2148 length:915 start_codon:yes stop_codon:yes gene_type:complete